MTGPHVAAVASPQPPFLQTPKVLGSLGLVKASLDMDKRPLEPQGWGQKTGPRG